ncbi:MAG: DUF1223 domain-containing protein [Pikeienuella sp.]
MKRRAIAALVGVGAVLATAPAGLTQEDASPIVVELFTSQGCPECPPADIALGALADRADVIALSVHVDYWDYLGWRDIFAMPGNTKRQRAYAEALHENTVYTPQMVFQGRETVIGSTISELDAAIMRQRARTPRAAVALRRDGDELLIEIAPGPANTMLKPEADVVLAYYLDSRTVKIEQGDNKGESISYRNVVSDWFAVGEWRGEAAELRAPARDGFDGVAAIVQAGQGGPILGAASIALR